EMPRQYLTIVRTNFPSFESEEEVREEKESLIEETEKLGEVFSSIDSLCIDTPQPTGRSKEGNKKIRAISQEKLREYLIAKPELSSPILLAEHKEIEVPAHVLVRKEQELNPGEYYEELERDFLTIRQVVDEEKANFTVNITEVKEKFE